MKNVKFLYKTSKNNMLYEFIQKVYMYCYNPVTKIENLVHKVVNKKIFCKML